jgi:thioester reductase-like protein
VCSSDLGARNVTALVRRTELSAESRIQQRLSRGGAAPETQTTDLRVVAGELTSTYLGLSSADLEGLRSDVGIIIHSASETSFLRSSKCHETNVLGMRNLLEFASSCRHRALIVYLSTAANSGAVTHCCLREEDGCKPDAKHHNDYTRSKAIAEQMLRDSGLPTLVLRPSIVLSAGLHDAPFARSMLWFVPLLNAFEAVPIDPMSRLDTVPVSFVTEVTLALLNKSNRSSDCYHLSAGQSGAIQCGAMATFLDRYYQRQSPLRLIPPSEWTRQTQRQFVRTPGQRKLLMMFRYYLPFLNMDVVYDNGRLNADLGAAVTHVPPLTSYLGELLAQIPHEAALAEAMRP